MAYRSRKRRRKQEELGVIWEIPDALWERIRPILEEYWPAKVTGASTPSGDGASTASCFGCGPVANGTTCPNGLATTAPSTVGFNVGTEMA